MQRWLDCLMPRRRRRPCVSLVRVVSPGQREASAALVRASSALRDAQVLSPQVSETADRLRDLRDRNHFAESIYQLYRGGER